MKATWLKRKWKDLKEEGHRYPWKDALLRMAADAISVGASLIVAFVVWYFFYLYALNTRSACAVM